jgi:hypothetical protein
MTRLTALSKGPAPGPALPLAQPSPPPFHVIGSHFAVGVAWLLMGCVGLVWLAPVLAQGSFLDSRLIAVTHLFTLGWITTVIMGVLYQIFPAMLGVGARSLRVARLSLLAQGTGTATLVAGLLTGTRELLAAGWVMLFLAVFGTAWNLLPQRRQARRNQQLGVYVSYAHMGFGLAMGVAGARIGDALGWWTTPRLGLIAAHFHLAAVGFATMTAFGVGSRMIPMFLGVSETPARSLRWLPRMLASGTVVFSVGTIGGIPAATWAGAVIMAAGAGLFLWLGLRWFGRRARRALDPATGLILAALIWLALAIPVGLDALARGPSRPAVLTSYGAILILGWLTSLILGVSYRVLPTLTWHHRFAARAREPNLPSLPEMVRTGVGWATLFLHGLGMLALVGGLHRHQATLARSGAILLTAAVLATAVHHTRMLLVRKGKPVLPPPPQGRTA